MAALIFWAVLGALAGAFAKLVLWDNRPEGWVSTMLFSIAGALGGGYMRVWLGGADSPNAPPHAFDILGMLLVLVGAAALLAAYHLLVERRSAAHNRPRRMAA